MWIPLAIASAAAAALCWRTGARFRARVAAAEARVRSAPAASTACDLPPLLRAFVARSGLAGTEPPRFVRFEQEGEMRRRPGAAWRPFRAVHTAAVAEPAFTWCARMGPVSVIDCLVDGRGRLEARMLGVLRMARAEGPETDRGELLRYLAEVAWVPAALGHNPNLRWQQPAAREVVGTAVLGGIEASLSFAFDGAGDLCEVSGRRGRMDGREVVDTPWRGRFADYRTFDGVRLPARSEVEWVLDGGPFAYWRGRITAMERG